MKRISLFSLLAAAWVGCGGSSHPATSPDAGPGDTQSTQDANKDDGQGMETGMDAAPDLGPIEQTCVPPADKDHPIEKLADTGCMDPKNPTEFAPSVLAYQVNSPLWSDKADKKRGFALPKGGKIHILDCMKEQDKCLLGPVDSGRWVFPVGTVMTKSFLFDGKVVETRLFIRFDEQTWVGYSYQWNKEQTEATIVDTLGAETMFDTGSRQVDWHLPSRDNCMECHFSTAGFTLGPEMKQMNRMMNGENQIDTLAKHDIFEQAPAKPYPAALATPYAGSWGPATDSASVEDRARSYLHANCNFCHRPDSNFPNIDLRYGIALENTNTCNITPERGLSDAEGAMLLTPGMPEMSTLWLRMKSLQDKVRMPSIASYVVDDDAVKLVGDWIKSIPASACPAM